MLSLYQYSIHFGLSALRMHGKNDKSVLPRGRLRSTVMDAWPWPWYRLEETRLVGESLGVEGSRIESLLNPDNAAMETHAEFICSIHIEYFFF